MGNYEPVLHAGTIELLDGTFIRFGPDEADTFNVPTSVSFSTEMPGGFGPADIVLPRPEGLDPLRARLFASVKLYDARSAETIYEGRITGLPIDSEFVTIECEGWMKALEDDQTARFLGINRDFNSWGEASVAYQLDDIASNWTYEPGTVVPDPTSGSPALLTDCELQWESTSRPDAASFFDAQGLDIGLVDYCWKQSGNASAFAWQVGVAQTDELTGVGDTTGNINAAGPGSGTLVGGPGRKFAAVEFWTIATTPADPTLNGRVGVYWTMLAVIGNHGLPLQGTVAPPNSARGLLVSDMASYLVGSFAPALNYTTGESGSIAPTPFAVPHAMWLDATTARAILDELVIYGGTDLYPLDAYVYRDRTFHLKGPTQHGETWRVRLDQATQEQAEGPDAAQRINGVQVVYDDGSGTRRTVGPPLSSSDLESEALVDTSADNPANQDRQRHYLALDAGITSQAGALLIGQMVLRARNIEAWRGSVTLSGEVQSEAGQVAPVAMVRAGDWLVVEDDEDQRPRRVVQTNYQDQTLQASVGALPDHLDSLLARAGISLSGRL